MEGGHLASWSPLIRKPRIKSCDVCNVLFPFFTFLFPSPRVTQPSQNKAWCAFWSFLSPTLLCIIPLPSAPSLPICHLGDPMKRGGGNIQKTERNSNFVARRPEGTGALSQSVTQISVSDFWRWCVNQVHLLCTGSCAARTRYLPHVQPLSLVSTEQQDIHTLWILLLKWSHLAREQLSLIGAPFDLIHFSPFPFWSRVIFYYPNVKVHSLYIYIQWAVGWLKSCRICLVSKSSIIAHTQKHSWNDARWF